MKVVIITSFFGIFLLGICGTGFADIQKTASYKVSVTIPSSIETKLTQKTTADQNSQPSASSLYKQKIVEEVMRNNHRVIVETDIVK